MAERRHSEQREALRQLLETEEQARKSVADAREEADRLVEKARSEAADRKEEARSKAKEEAQSIVQTAKEEGPENENSSDRHFGPGDLETLRQRADANRDAAAEFLFNWVMGRGESP
ncbi:ATP synthase F0 subunit B [Salinispira pacifica]